MAVRERKRIGVVLPVGPKDAEAALDTLASALYYLDESRVIVVVDDSGQPAEFAARSRELSPEIVVLPGPAARAGRLRRALGQDRRGYQWLLERYQPDVVLRLDSDALIIGAGLEDCAAREFAEDRQTGLLGSYRIDPNGRRATGRGRPAGSASRPACAACATLGAGAAPPVHGPGRARRLRRRRARTRRRLHPQLRGGRRHLP